MSTINFLRLLAVFLDSVFSMISLARFGVARKKVFYELKGMLILANLKAL
ncbi:hypothetical protein HPNQ4099_0267 [Helicobacter pylori NQ4099]|uniref:Uncharacterized protein n=2 Tax=Helicobacter pylori TaxID=210 RepID=J0J1S9_HELPX|nr:hypothetical protein HPNQ4099_0267 [Helicobacter pylori NQ4099]EJB35197.1 hypothetical protein HPNQ4076_0063 [Helicobacter pylori NQ4076]